MANGQDKIALGWFFGMSKSIASFSLQLIICMLMAYFFFLVLVCAHKIINLESKVLALEFRIIMAEIKLQRKAVLESPAMVRA
ncbi:hypothetical protein NpPPO83_00008443 [Neofusicoccum parvum]|uniref:Uncharacterized protein n=1 Tax=Neofusicoccum parvum TaxID=310453 RepID=A0ACB5S6X7_9PEZI|nr:hypothetical protein NpPPO83_00008443 [Neofusicoccum parvum]